MKHINKVWGRKERLTLLLLWLSQEQDSASWGAIPRWKGWSLRQVWHSGGSGSESPGGKCITVDPGYLRLACGCFSTLTIGLLIHLRTCQHRKRLWTLYGSSWDGAAGFLMRIKAQIGENNQIPYKGQDQFSTGESTRPCQGACMNTHHSQALHAENHLLLCASLP